MKFFGPRYIFSPSKPDCFLAFPPHLVDVAPVAERDALARLAGELVLLAGRDGQFRLLGVADLGHHLPGVAAHRELGGGDLEEGGKKTRLYVVERYWDYIVGYIF